MRHKNNWQKSFAAFILAMLLVSACKIFSPPPVPFKPGDPTATPLGSDITDPDFIKGVEAFQEKNYQEVLTRMSAVIESNPNLAPPYRYRAVAYWGFGDCQSGLQDAEKALSINHDYAAAWGVRGLMYSCLGNDQQALQDYQKALSIDPSLAFIHHNLGYYYYTQGDYEKSLEEYGLSVAIDPNRSATWSGKAEALTRLGRYDECITEATKALNVNPKEWLAYTDRGYCEEFVGDYVGAIQDYEAFLGHDPTNVDIWYNLGNAQRSANFLQDAISSYSKALDLSPTYYQANINRGLAYTDLKEFDKALRDFNNVLAFGDIPQAYSGRGTVYYWLGRYEDAIADLEKATQMMPDRPHSYCMLAYTYFEVGRYQDSLDAAERVNEIAPGCGGERLFVVEAHSYYALGQYEQGIAFINTTFENLGIYMAGYYYRGIMYAELGQNDEAIKDLEFFLASSENLIDYDEQIADAKARLARLKP